MVGYTADSCGVIHRYTVEVPLVELGTINKELAAGLTKTVTKHCVCMKENKCTYRVFPTTTAT